MKELFTFVRPLTCRFKTGLAVIVLFHLLAVPVVAGQFEDAMAASDRGDYTTALQLLQSLAAQGDVRAEFSLGHIYSQALGVTKDYTQAHIWFSRAAAHLPPGSVDRDTALLNRDFVAAKMTPAQIAQAQQLAPAWNSK